MAWNSKTTVCRSRKSGKFSTRGKCKAFKRTKVKLKPKSFFGGQFSLFG